ncbi:hypothetical protein D3C71_1942260 [compost metagenome]
MGSAELIDGCLQRVVVKVRHPQRLVVVGGVENPVLLKVVATLLGPDSPLGISDDAHLLVVQQPLQIGLSRLAIFQQVGAHADALCT